MMRIEFKIQPLLFGPVDRENSSRTRRPQLLEFTIRVSYRIFMSHRKRVTTRKQRTE